MKKELIVMLTALLAITGCAGTGSDYQPVVDGPVSHTWPLDLGECRRVAEKKRYLNSETGLKATTGAILGGLIGAVDSGEGAAAGAIAGGLIGAGEGAAAAHKDRKKIVIRCMQGRGHRVVG